MEAKFKVGDKVRILDGSTIENYTGIWNMPEHIGDVCKIKEIELYSNGRIGYRVEENRYIYDERGLELVEDKPKHEFKVDDIVRIRQWDDMMAEFGGDSEYIDIIPGFMYDMKPLCGLRAVITDFERNFHGDTSPRVKLSFIDVL